MRLTLGEKSDRPGISRNHNFSYSLRLALECKQSYFSNCIGVARDAKMSTSIIWEKKVVTSDLESFAEAPGSCRWDLWSDHPGGTFPHLRGILLLLQLLGHGTQSTQWTRHSDGIQADIGRLNQDKEKRRATAARGLVWLVTMRRKVWSNAHGIDGEFVRSTTFLHREWFSFCYLFALLTCVATLSKAFVFQDLPQAVFWIGVLRFTLKSETLNNKDKQRKSVVIHACQ